MAKEKCRQSKLPDRHWSHPTNGPEYQGLHSRIDEDEGCEQQGNSYYRALETIFAGNSGTRRLETRPIANATDTSDRIFLSRAACGDMGMILNKFPTLGEVNLATSELCLPATRRATGQANYSPHDCVRG